MKLRNAALAVSFFFIPVFFYGFSFTPQIMIFFNDFSLWLEQILQKILVFKLQNCMFNSVLHFFETIFTQKLQVNYRKNFKRKSYMYN